MGKIFRYELRRTVCSRFFLGVLALLLWNSWQMLNTSTILGVSNTAPFSPWSFGGYLAQQLMLLCLALLFFLWSQYRGKARGVRCLTNATPVEPGRYLLARSAAALTAWLALALTVVLLGLGFLVKLFGSAVPAGQLALTAVVTLLPPTLLFFGGGLLAGEQKPAFLPGLMALAVFAGFVPWNLYGAAFFAEYPQMLGMLDPPFSLPLSAALEKLGYSLLGLAALLCAVRRAKVKNGRANF